MVQSTDTLLLVRPAQFRKNEETAVNNYFQEDLDGHDAAGKAQEEFDNFVRCLNGHKINTLVIEDDGRFDTPDSLFPNNCISLHKRSAVLYPMFAENRRRERQLDYLGALSRWGLDYDDVIDYTYYEEQERFLEGTGCLILDRLARIAYCSLSPRADAEIVHRFCLDMGYEPFIFEAAQTVGGLRKPIYHSNVMMSIGTEFAVLCAESIDNPFVREALIEKLEGAGKTVLKISQEQMAQFAGNILEVRSSSGDPLIVMSSQAYHAFTSQQLQLLQTWGDIVHSPLDTIERGGGGSARCMIAEVFY